MGVKLFTFMSVDMAAELSRRAYTSDAKSYPVSGTKPLNYGPWFDIVHKQRDYFVANTLDDISKVFPDYELIGSLGCGSVVNMPVILGDELVGTLNLLDAEQYYTPRARRADPPLSVAARQAHGAGGTAVQSCLNRLNSILAEATLIASAMPLKHQLDMSSPPISAFSPGVARFCGHRNSSRSCRFSAAKRALTMRVGISKS